MLKETRILMGMPITVEIIDGSVTQDAINKVFEYFKYVNEKFSTYKKTSEITKINDGLVDEESRSKDMKIIFDLAEKTKNETDGYFDIINNNGKYDPSGIVKGWAIFSAAQLLNKMGFENFYVEAGGDIQTQGLPAQAGKNKDGWKVGIRNPFKLSEIVKTVNLKKNEGVATSGTYERGNHIYNPKNRSQELLEIMSITVIGSNVYEADRFATAAFAMQKEGINFIEKLNDFEAYMINKKGIATMTSGFEKYL